MTLLTRIGHAEPASRLPKTPRPRGSRLLAFRRLPDEGYNGARRFPLSIPLDSPENGNAAAQASHYRLLLDWDKPVRSYARQFIR